MNEPAKALATVRSYNQLIAVLRSRADELEVTRETLDHAAKLAPRYAQKLLAPVPVKNLGPNSLGGLLSVLGLALVVVEDRRPTELPKREKRKVRSACAAA